MAQQKTSFSVVNETPNAIKGVRNLRPARAVRKRLPRKPSARGNSGNQRRFGRGGKYNPNLARVHDTSLTQRPLLFPGGDHAPPLAESECDELDGESGNRPDTDVYLDIHEGLLEAEGYELKHQHDDGDRLETGFGDERPPSPMAGDSPNVHTYQQKKNIAQGMMDLALVSANTNQLRYVLESSSSHPYYYFNLIFISFSIILQVAVGVGLIMNSLYNITKKADVYKANRINNMTVLGVFLITIVNVFITSFSVASPVATQDNDI